VSWLFLLIAAVALVLSDLAVRALSPWAEMRRLAAGLIRPDFFSIEMMSVVWTVAFAVVGVAIGASAGLLLALVFARLRAVRLLCAFLRSVHEMFWALLLIQIAGLSATTGILAVAIPYSGIFAKVFAEMIEEADTNLLVVIKEMRDAARAADESNDPGTVDLFSRIVQIHEKHEWFLREILKKKDGVEA